MRRKIQLDEKEEEEEGGGGGGVKGDVIIYISVSNLCSRVSFMC